MKYCLIGEKLSHSYSEKLHRSFGYDYSLKELSPCELQSFVSFGGYDGFNVTIPYKKSIIPFLDGVSDLVARIGAVNTVKVKDGKKYGFNTDYYGFYGTVKKSGAVVNGKNVLILGSGGACAVVKAVMEDLGAKTISVVSRSGDLNYNNVYDRTDAQIIVNATPVGTFPDITATPIDLTRFNQVEAVFDLIYNPYKSALIRQAKELGIKCANGLTMLVIQALKAREIWFDLPATDDEVKKATSLLKNLTLNVALTGMPSCGKSTVGRALAELTGKPFIDTDDLILSLTGRTPENIIEEDGEQVFRTVETEAVKKACSARGAIIALGGGAVLKEENRDFLKSTAFNVFIERDLALTVKDGRPLLKNADVEKVFEERAPFYNGVADCRVRNDKAPEDVAKEIIKNYESFGY